MSKPPTIVIQAHRDPFRSRDKIEINIWKQGPEGIWDGRMVFERAPEGTSIAPTLVASKEELQALADSLWEAGVRPMQAEGSAGQLAAVERHLADMRHLAFAKTDVPRPEAR